MRWATAVAVMVCLAAALQVSPVEGARILAVFPFPAKSHVNVLSGLTKELAARGHKLVVLTPYPQTKPIPNLTEIDMMPIMKESKEKSLVNLFDAGKMKFYEMAFMMWGMGLGTTEAFVNSPQLKKILEDKQGFDLVITEAFLNEALYGLAHHFKAPLVLVCPFGGFHWHNYGLANPAPTSYVPNPMTAYSAHMTFTERITNTLFTWFWDIGHYLYYMPGQDALNKKLFGPNALSISELDSLPSLIMVNQHFTLNYPRPLLPNMIEVGGMHVSREVKPLDKEFKDFLDGAKQGAIYFSMGSNLRSDQMPAEKVMAFVEAFAELPQKVLWKWEAETLPGQPKNLKVASWMPQQEILAHPNVKVFITHGGLLSAQEAAYHGTTVVGIPIFGDQMLNMKKAQQGGFGIYLDYNNITKSSVLWALNEAMNNPSIREASHQRSLQYRDQPQTPMDKAIFWTEYVLRHKGAPHLKSAGARLKWYQLYLLDVYAAIFAPVLVLLWLCKKCCCGKRTSSIAKTPQKSAAKAKKNN